MASLSERGDAFRQRQRHAGSGDLDTHREDAWREQGEKAFKAAGLERRRVLVGLALVFFFFIAFLFVKKEDGVENDLGNVEEKLRGAQDTPPAAGTTVNSKIEIQDKKVIVNDEQVENDYEYPAPGFVRVPKLPEGPRHPDDGKLHIIFSSGCNYFQHWQSELLLASAMLVGQRGRITRIVSGCHDKSAEQVRHRHQTFPEGEGDRLVPLQILNRSVNENFGLYITPSFEGAVDFPWINKPNSIDYFVRNARAELDKFGETIIAILDPDFIFMKPLTQSGTDPEEIIATRGQGEDPDANSPIDYVKEGRPVAQRYGLEGVWVHNFNVAEITADPDSPATRMSESEARKYTSVGPPLMLHVNDLTNLAKLWAEYMPRVLKRDKDILADMWAYSIAAAHLGLKHTTLDNYMISAHGSSGQGYKFVDSWTSFRCGDLKIPPGMRTPTFIHMASNFKAPDRKRGPYMFHKGHVPPDILSCSSPLIIPPPEDLWEVTTDRQSKQHAWILCHCISNLNNVALRYKEKFCPNGFEQRELIRLIQRKTQDRSCRKGKDKWCYPLAQIEGLPDGWRSS